MKLTTRFSGLMVGAALFGSVLAVPAFAQGNGAVGNWLITDHGQGAWAGGALMADGSMTGGGAFSFSLPAVQLPAVQEVAKITPMFWQPNADDPSMLDLTLTITGIKGPVLPIGVPETITITVPQTGSGAPVVIPQMSSNTYLKVNLHKTLIS